MQPDAIQPGESRTTQTAAPPPPPPAVRGGGRLAARCEGGVASPEPGASEGVRLSAPRQPREESAGVVDLTAGLFGWGGSGESRSAEGARPAEGAERTEAARPTERPAATPDEAARDAKLRGEIGDRNPDEAKRFLVERLASGKLSAEDSRSLDRVAGELGLQKELPRMREYATRMREVGTRASAHAEKVNGRIQALDREMKGAIEAHQTPDGMDDARTEQLRQEYRQRLEEILSASRDEELAGDVADLVKDGRELLGPEALKEGGLAGISRDLRSMDASVEKYVANGAAIVSKSEVQAARNEALHADRDGVLEAMQKDRTQMDAFRTQLGHMWQDNISVLGITGMGWASTWNGVFGGPTVFSIRDATQQMGADIGRLDQLQEAIRKSDGPATTGRLIREHDEVTRRLHENLKKIGEDSEQFLGRSAGIKEIYQSALSMYVGAQAPGLGPMMLGTGVARGGITALDGMSGAKGLDWAELEKQVILGMGDGLAGGAASKAASAAKAALARTALGHSLGPIGRATFKGMLRGGLAGAGMGGFRPAMEGGSWEDVRKGAIEGAKWGALLDGAFSAGSAWRAGRLPAEVAQKLDDLHSSTSRDVQALESTKIPQARAGVQAQQARIDAMQKAFDEMPAGPEKGPASAQLKKAKAELRALESQVNRLTQKMDDLRGALKAMESVEMAPDTGFPVNEETPWWDSRKGAQTGQKNLADHYRDHGTEFLATSADDYAQKARDFAANPPPGTMMLPGPTGDVILYNPQSGTIGIYARPPQGGVIPVSLHKVNPRSDLWPRGYTAPSALEYFLEMR